MPTLSDYKNFVKKYNKEFSLVGISKLNKFQLKKKIEDVLSEQRTEIKDEWIKLHPNEYGQKEAPKKTAPKKTAPKKTAPKKTAPKKNEYDNMFAYMTGMANKSVKFTEKQLETALKNIDKHLTGGQKLEWKRVYNDKRRVGFKPQDDRKKVIEAIEPKTDFEKTLKKKLQEREKSIEPKPIPKLSNEVFNRRMGIINNKKKLKDFNNLANDMKNFMLSKLSGLKKSKKKYTNEELKIMYDDINFIFKDEFKTNNWNNVYKDFLKLNK